MCAPGGFSSLSLRTAAKPRRRGPTAVRYLYDVLQRYSAVWCGARRQKNTPAALRVTRLNIAPLSSRLRSAARHPQRAADTRRAIHNSTAVGVSEAIPASVPFAETPPREGPATRLMTRPLHRERSDERIRRPTAPYRCVRVFRRPRDAHRERACGPALVHRRPGIARNVCGTAVVRKQSSNAAPQGPRAP